MARRADSSNTMKQNQDPEIMIDYVLELARPKGERHLDNGTALVEPAPDIAPMAWRHLIYAPMTSADMAEIEGKLHQRFPDQMRRFYKYHNGISLFAHGLDVWGKRYNWARTGDAVWQPFDIVTLNRPGGRPKNSPYEVVFFGTTDRSENWVYFHSPTGIIGKTGRNIFNERETWSEFDTWLAAEISLRFLG